MFQVCLERLNSNGWQNFLQLITSYFRKLYQNRNLVKFTFYIWEYQRKPCFASETPKYLFHPIKFYTLNIRISETEEKMYLKTSSANVFKFEYIMTGYYLKHNSHTTC